MGEGAFESIRKAYGETVAWWRALDEGAKQLYLKSSFPLAFSCNSGKIENDEITFHDTKEFFEHGRVVGFIGDPRTIFEIANLKTVWQEAPGSFKLGDYINGRFERPSLLPLQTRPLV